MLVRLPTSAGGQNHCQIEEPVSAKNTLAEILMQQPAFGFSENNRLQGAHVLMHCLDEAGYVVVPKERTFSSGMLSVTTTYRLLVTGDCDLRELDRLIRLLTLQKNFLEEFDAERKAESGSTEAIVSCK